MTATQSRVRPDAQHQTQSLQIQYFICQIISMFGKANAVEADGRGAAALQSLQSSDGSTEYSDGLRSKPSSNMLPSYTPPPVSPLSTTNNITCRVDELATMLCGC